MNKQYSADNSSPTVISAEEVSISCKSGRSAKSQPSQGCITGESTVKASHHVSVEHRGGDSECSSPSSSVTSLDSASSASTLKSEENGHAEFCSPTEMLKGMSALKMADSDTIDARIHESSENLHSCSMHDPAGQEMRLPFRRSAAILRGKATGGIERSRSSNKVTFHSQAQVLEYEQEEADYDFVISKPRIEVVNGQTVIYTETTQKAPVATSVPPSSARQVPQKHQASQPPSSGLVHHHHLSNSHSSPMKPQTQHHLNHQFQCSPVPNRTAGMVYSSPSAHHRGHEHHQQFVQHQHSAHPHQQFNPHMQQMHIHHQVASPQMQFQPHFGSPGVRVGGGVQLFNY